MMSVGAAQQCCLLHAVLSVSQHSLLTAVDLLSTGELYDRSTMQPLE